MHRHVPVLIALLLCVQFVRAADPPIDPATKKKVLLLLLQLESADYEERDKATLALEALPAAATPMIEAALAKGDLSPEVAQRLEDKVGMLRRKVGATKYENTLRAQFLWDRATALAGYNGGGHTNPKWDAAAREAIVLHIRPRRDPNISPRDQKLIAAALKKAIDLGCDDPYIRFAFAQRTFEQLMPPNFPRAVITAWRKASDDIIAGNYPAYIKMEALHRRVESTLLFQGLTNETRKKARAYIDQIYALVPQALKDGAGRHLIMGIITPTKTYLANVENFNQNTAHERTIKALTPTTKGTTICAFLEADYQILRGYAIRNGTYGQGWTPEKREKELADAVKQCKVAVDAALAPDPTDPEAINRMIRYMCLARSPADEFEKWFIKGLEAYPNDFLHCQMKHSYLKENGTADQCIAFGRQCLADGNWPSRIPLMICNVYADMGADPNDPEVWNDLSLAYEQYLKRCPNAYADRSAYLRTAGLAGKWDVAKTQFDALGDNLIPRFFESQKQIDEWRKQANEAGGKPKKR